MSSMSLQDPFHALAQLHEALQPVECELLPLDAAQGRILAAAFKADRPSPPLDVSAMDGYALRLDDLAAGPLTIAGEASMGRPVQALPAGQAMRIMTGAPVPVGAEAVVPREKTQLQANRLTLTADTPPPKPFANIRRAGENVGANEEIVGAGNALTPALAGAAAAFGHTHLTCRRAVRVSLLITGDELAAGEPAEPLPPHRIRDSNGPLLTNLVHSLPWATLHTRQHVTDDLPQLAATLASALAGSDTVWLTGGVSVGDHDHVRAAVEAVGGRVVFHRLAIRPGKPILGAIGPAGQQILGFPGNPVAVACCAQLFGLPLLRRQAGHHVTMPRNPLAILRGPQPRAIPLWNFPLVRHSSPGEVELVPSRGSGDLVALSRSDGFLILPPNSDGMTPRAIQLW